MGVVGQPVWDPVCSPSFSIFPDSLPHKCCFSSLTRVQVKTWGLAPGPVWQLESLRPLAKRQAWLLGSDLLAAAP